MEEQKITHSLILKNSSVPRTVFYELATSALRALDGYEAKDGELLIPEEDTAEETNWPRFGNPSSAYIRPRFTNEPEGKIPLNIPLKTNDYIQTIADHCGKNSAKTFVIINMNPDRRLPLAFCHRKNVIVADGCLAGHERQMNPKTISLPALSMIKENILPMPGKERSIKVSFQGNLSHPCRHELMKLDNGDDIRIIGMRSPGHYGKIDAVEGIEDNFYTNLLDNSTFGIVARGDALFSYRLLETISRGAIPIIISDGWILPFDRTIDWDSCSLRFHQEAINSIPFVVEKIEDTRIMKLQTNSIKNYNKYLSRIELIMKTMMTEAHAIKRNDQIHF